MAGRSNVKLLLVGRKPVGGYDLNVLTLNYLNIEVEFSDSI